MEWIGIFIHAVLTSLMELLYLFGVLIGIGFLLGYLERYIHTYLVLAFGSRGILLTAWIGTPIHELGHVIQCFIWKHQVTQVKFLQINAADRSLGYVEHKYNRHSLYQQIGLFFIGIGPLISGIASLIVGMYFLVPKTFKTFMNYIQDTVTASAIDIETIWTTVKVGFLLGKSLYTLENLINPYFWVFIILAISISSHIALSKPDMKGSLKGLLAIYIFLVGFKLLTRLLGFDSNVFITTLAKYNAYVLAFSTIAVLFSITSLIISYGLYKIKTKFN